MEQIWETEGRPLSLWVSISCKGKTKFRVCASDGDHINSNFADRTIEVDEYRKIYLSLPVSPKRLKVTVKQINGSKDFLVDIKEKTLKTYEIYKDAESRQFLDFAMNFSKQCGYEKALPTGRIFKTKDNNFRIKYFPVIIAEGRVSTTPARVGHNTGTIEVAKLPFDRYTIPMRMIILLHEFSHVYRNPKIGLDISNEVGADLNALYLYLGMGFSKVDAIYVFCNVFYKAQTPSNMHRMRKIYDYIERFDKGEFAKVLTE